MPVIESSTARDRILDAAARYSAVSEKPAIAELAREAGVSRPTVYRIFGDREAVFRALWEREVERIMDARSVDVDDLDSLVERIVEVADEFSSHESLAPTLVTDAHLVARYILERFGYSQRIIFERLRAGLVRVQQGGSVRAGDPDELTAMVMLITQSAVQSRAMISEFLSPDAWRRELSIALTGYLRA